MLSTGNFGTRLANTEALHGIYKDKIQPICPCSRSCYSEINYGIFLHYLETSPNVAVLISDPAIQQTCLLMASTDRFPTFNLSTYPALDIGFSMSFLRL